MIFAKTDKFCQSIKIQFFPVMLFNIVKKLIELAYIFFLLRRTYIGKQILHMNMVVSQIYEDL